MFNFGFLRTEVKSQQQPVYPPTKEVSIIAKVLEVVNKVLKK